MCSWLRHGTSAGPHPKRCPAPIGLQPALSPCSAASRIPRLAPPTRGRQEGADRRKKCNDSIFPIPDPPTQLTDHQYWLPDPQSWLPDPYPELTDQQYWLPDPQSWVPDPHPELTDSQYWFPDPHPQLKGPQLPCTQPLLTDSISSAAEAHPLPAAEQRRHSQSQGASPHKGGCCPPTQHCCCPRAGPSSSYCR